LGSSRSSVNWACWVSQFESGMGGLIQKRIELFRSGQG
jgi:hypothetical protein